MDRREMCWSAPVHNYVVPVQPSQYFTEGVHCRYNWHSSQSMGPLNFQVSHLIGQGAFGRVYKAYCHQTRETVAYKVVSIVGRSDFEIKTLRHEYEIGKLLQHPNIVRTLYYFETPFEIVLVSEYAKRDLRRAIDEDGVFCEGRTSKIMRDLISGLFYLHSNRIIHRDLKPQNVVLDALGNAKICDFGFVKVMGTDCESNNMSMRGTPMYMAPEQLSSYSYDEKADLWSLGVIAYELLKGYPPYRSNTITSLLHMMKSKEIKWPENLSSECLSFIVCLLQKNPHNRLCWPYLKYHAFVRKKNFVNRHGTPKQKTTANPDLKSELCGNPVVKSIAENHHKTIEENKAAEIEEWMQFIERCISNVTHFGDTSSLSQRHSLGMIMKAIMNFYSRPTMVMKIITLLSLPFAVEKITLEQVIAVKQTYRDCHMIKDLAVIFKHFLKQAETNNLDTFQEKCFKQLTILMCSLTYGDKTFMKQLFQGFNELEVLKLIKLILSIRLSCDPLAVVKYFLSILTRMYTDLKRSRLVLADALQDSKAELRILLCEQKDLIVPVRICIFISLIGCVNSQIKSENDRLSNSKKTIKAKSSRSLSLQKKKKHHSKRLQKSCNL